MKFWRPACSAPSLVGRLGLFLELLAQICCLVGAALVYPLLVGVQRILAGLGFLLLAVLLERAQPLHLAPVCHAVEV